MNRYDGCIIEPMKPNRLVKVFEGSDYRSKGGKDRSPHAGFKVLPARV